MGARATLCQKSRINLERFVPYDGYCGHLGMEYIDKNIPLLRDDDAPNLHDEMTAPPQERVASFQTGVIIGRAWIESLN